jgi:hypothetical protein
MHPRAEVNGVPLVEQRAHLRGNERRRAGGRAATQRDAGCGRKGLSAWARRPLQRMRQHTASQTESAEPSRTRAPRAAAARYERDEAAVAYLLWRYQRQSWR